MRCSVVCCWRCGSRAVPGRVVAMRRPNRQWRRSVSMADVPAALLAGGLATRLRPITETIPKALVEVAGRPFIDHQLELLRRNGIRKIVLCLGHLGHLVQDHVGDGSRFGVAVSYSFDGDRLL